MKEYLIFHGGGGGKSRQRLHHREFSSKVVSALQDAGNRRAVPFKAISTCSFDRFHYYSPAPLTVTDRSVQWTYNECVHIGVVFFHCCYFRMRVCVIADIFRLSCFKPSSNVYAVIVVLQACSWVIVISWKVRRRSFVRLARIFDSGSIDMIISIKSKQHWNDASPFIINWRNV